MLNHMRNSVLMLASNPFVALEVGGDELGPVHNTATAFGADLFTLLRWIGIFMCVIALLGYCCIGYLYNVTGEGTPRIKHERKQKMKKILLIAICLGLVITFFSSLENVAGVFH